MEFENFEDIIKAFRTNVIKQSRSNLTRLKKNSSNTLYNSLKSSQQQEGNKWIVEFEMMRYGEFQDMGVSGKKKKYNTPFSYTNKMPPPSKLDKWIVKRGFAPRDKNGKLLPRKSVQFAFARGIYMNGIKPSLFFTKPFLNSIEKLPPELLEALQLDINIILINKLKEIK